MTAKERMAREARQAREAPRERPAAIESGEDASGPVIEFEDRSDEEYRAAVLEVMAALDWVRQQRAKGNLPS